MKIAYLSLAALLIAACNTSQKRSEKIAETEVASPDAAIDSLHTAKNSLDWSGRYTGTIPTAADTAGLQLDVVLKDDDTYVLNTKDVTSGDTKSDEGEIAWEDNQTYIRLKGKSLDYYFKLGENIITAIPGDGAIPDTLDLSSYVLHKDQPFH